MTSSLPRVLAALLVLVVPPSSPRAHDHAPSAPPNLLLVVVDDVGWYDLDRLPTPAFDALRERGVEFRRAWANPFCSPTRHTIQFGRYSGRDLIGTVVQPRSLPGATPTDERNPGSPFTNLSIAEVLGSAGYATATFGKWHLSNDVDGLEAEAPRIHGYDTARAVAIRNLDKAVGGYFGWYRIDDGEVSYETEYATRAQADALVEWVRDREGPWFAHLAFHAAHAPMEAPPGDLLPAGYLVGPKPRDRFEAMILALDAKLGDVLRAVDLERTVVAFVSDNGTAVAGPGQDPKKLKGTLYEGALNVPLVLAGAGIAPASAPSSALVGTVDLFATLAELAGVEPSAGAGADSRSLVPVLADPTAPGPRRFLFAEHSRPNGPGPRDLVRVAVRGERFKLTFYDPDGDGPTAPRVALWDLLLDPDETSKLDPATLGREELAAREAMLEFAAERMNEFSRFR